jgi:hypothetical protein
MDQHANNGILTRVFGPYLWGGLHCISFGYPLEPTDIQKKEYKDFFCLLGKVLPCKYCRISYDEFINNGDTKLTDQVMENRHTFTKWLYDLHNVVNNKLGVNYGVSYEDICERYESYRSKCTTNPKEKGCITPLDLKAQSFKIASLKDCPIIEYNIALKFVKYARLRNLSLNNYIILAKFKEKNTLDKCLKNKLHNETWCMRNKECNEIIQYMRIKGVPSIEEYGIWKGYPTIPELKLILRLSSNLTNDELFNLIKIMDTSIYNK